ncbi:uncharacterized protein LOC113521440 [Galleria mellonella]|uniref:Uncharacterized protein LOC113521440 n=1 Tax=Galleria mellonella TaxID=7137 RepID=A0ABM3N2N0_GALME|nr:uncharacterized protein LOC113521440 [Galleria mellonella]
MSETQSRRRVTYTQLQNLWEFLKDHREIAVGYNKSAQAREHSKQMWLRVASVLNSVGEGAVKSGPEWSKYWLVDLKAKIKRKNRLRRDASSQTGGGPSIYEELSEMDIKFLSILGADYGSGLPGVQMQPILIEEPQPAAYNPSQHSTSEGRSEEAVWLNVDLEGNSDDLTTAVSRPSDTGTNTDSGTTQIIEVPSTSSAHIMVTERIESPRPSTSSIDMQSNVPSGITQFVEGRKYQEGGVDCDDVTCPLQRQGSSWWQLPGHEQKQS